MNNNFRVETDTDNIAWLHFDTPDASANILTSAALEELEQHLITIAQAHPRGLVILSDKNSGFIAGADVKSFAKITDPLAAEKLIRHVHDIFHRLQSLSFPTVAIIHGFCLGGGLELALACDYRVTRNDGSTRLGFPEVRLGIFPGFGGSVRSIKRIGHLKAMELMLSGRTVSGKAAKYMGLSDLAVPDRQLKHAARKLINEKPAPFKPALMQRLAGSGLLRPLIAIILRKQVAKQASKAHYPAPYTLIDHWVKHASHSKDLYDSEAVQVSRLIASDTAQNLIRVFLLQDQLKKLGNKQQFTPTHVHVVGGGVMGGDIAAWCALKGMRVTLQDRAPKYLGRAIQRAHDLFKKKLKDRYLVQDAKDRLIADHLGNGISKADVVIEAIFEDIDAKRALYAQLEPKMKLGALLATNTSSIPIEVLAEQLQQPNRLIGLHFFNPVAKMPLVEIVKHKNTDTDALQQALAFTLHISKLPLPVKSSPGFLVNRVLMPYLLEAVTLYEEGVPAVAIDKAAVKFGMPMGPVELADTVGLDICLSVAQKMETALNNAVPEVLQKMVDAGKLGRKSGQGFYVWKKGKPVKSDLDKDYQPAHDIADRMILRLVNESVACLREGVVEDKDLIDAGIIFGTGFAPFRGGPMHYIDIEGGTQLMNTLKNLQSSHGDHFQPDSGWSIIT